MLKMKKININNKKRRDQEEKKNDIRNYELFPLFNPNIIIMLCNLAIYLIVSSGRKFLRINKRFIFYFLCEIF